MKVLVFRDKWGNIRDEWKTISIIIVLLVIWNLSAIYFTNLRNGRPAMFEGKVVWVEHGVNRYQGYNYTDVKIIITLDHTNTVYLWGFVEFDTGTSYKIYCVKEIVRNPSFPWWMGIRYRVTEIEVVNIV